MAGNAYLAVFAVVACLFVFTLHAQTAECEKKVCLGCASEHRALILFDLKQNRRRGQPRQNNKTRDKKRT